MCTLWINNALANDHLVKIWSPFTGELIRNLNGHTKGLSDIAWSSDSVYLASASDDHTIRIWDVDSVCSAARIYSEQWLTLLQGISTRTLKGHTSFVFCVNYNMASNLLVSGACDGDVRIWNAAKGKYVTCSLVLAHHCYREMHEDDTRSCGLCHGGPFQPGCNADRFMCP